MNYTKGPWGVVNHGYGFVVKTESLKRTKYGASRYAAIGGFDRSDPQQLQEAEANAHLIAAAPDLLEAAIEALKEIQAVMYEAYNNANQVCCGRSGTECCGCPDAEWSEQDQKTMDRFVKHENALRAAIKKALGEQNV